MKRINSFQPHAAQRSVVALLIAATAMIGLSWTAGQAQADTRTTTATVICKSSPIPAGFVIIAQTTNLNCSNALNNAWVIDSPNPAGTVICKVSPFPAGYVITAQTTNLNCSNALDNAWFVRTPQNPDVICKVSPFPAGYVINGQTTNLNCSNALNNAWAISRP